MAYNFNGTNQYLTTSGPITGVPLTFSCWFYTPLDSTNKVLVNLGNTSGTPTHRCQLTITTTNFVQMSLVGSTQPFAQSTNTYNNNSWNHACGVCASTSSRIVYLNNVASPIETTTCIQNSLFTLNIGARWNPTLGNYFNGLIADVGIWNAALTVDEINSLAKGMACNKIRPQSLVFYAPLVRDLIDVKGGLPINNINGATVSTNHTRVYA